MKNDSVENHFSMCFTLPTLSEGMEAVARPTSDLPGTLPLPAPIPECADTRVGTTHWNLQSE